MSRGTFPACCCQCCQCCGEPLLTHTSTGSLPMLPGNFSSVSCRVIALFLWVLVCTRICSCPPKWSLCIPQSCGSPITKSCCTSSPDSLGSPSPFVRSPGLEAWCGVQNLHNSGRASLVLLFSSLWVTQPVGMGFDFCHDGIPPTISLWFLLRLWTWGIFFWWIPVSSCHWQFNS